MTDIAAFCMPQKLNTSVLHRTVGMREGRPACLHRAGYRAGRLQSGRDGQADALHACRCEARGSPAVPSQVRTPDQGLCVHFLVSTLLPCPGKQHLLQWRAAPPGNWAAWQLTRCRRGCCSWSARMRTRWGRTGGTAGRAPSGRGWGTGDCRTAASAHTAADARSRLRVDASKHAMKVLLLSKDEVTDAHGHIEVPKQQQTPHSVSSCAHGALPEGTWSQGGQSPSQQRRLHWCRPQLRVAVQRLSHLHACASQIPRTPRAGLCEGVSAFKPQSHKAITIPCLQGRLSACGRPLDSSAGLRGQ